MCLSNLGSGQLNVTSDFFVVIVVCYYIVCDVLYGEARDVSTT